MTNIVKVSFGNVNGSTCEAFEKFLKSFNNDVLETLNFLIKRCTIPCCVLSTGETEELFVDVEESYIIEVYQMIDSIVMKYKLKSRADALELLIRTSGIEWKDAGTLTITSNNRVNIIEKLNKDREENKFCDLQIFIGEKCFPAHKCVLAASSEYFASLLHANTKTITIFNMPQADVFEVVLDYIYTDKITLNKENYLLILKTAEFLKLEELRKTCEDYVILSPHRRKRASLSKIFAITDQEYPPEINDENDHLVSSSETVQNAISELEPEDNHVGTTVLKHSVRKARKGKTKTKETGYGFSCQICRSYFKTKSHLKRHMISHSGERKHCCTTCGKLFLKVDHLTRHERTHSTDRPFHCDNCEKKFKTKDNLKRHQLTHSNERPFFCELCAKQFKDKAGLLIHQKSHNKTEPVCPHCGKRFKQQNRLAYHIIRHNNPLVCKECGKTFNFLNHLRRHMMMHTGVRPFNCETCGRQFINEHGLKLHQKKHTGIGLHACAQCDRKFLDKFHLKRHMLTHTGQKPYKCTVCERSFSRADNCEIHRKQCIVKTALKKEHESFAKLEGDKVKIKRVQNINPLLINQEESSTESSEQHPEIHNIAIAVDANEVKNCRYGRISKRLPELKLVLLEKDPSSNMPSTSVSDDNNQIQYTSTIDMEGIAQIQDGNCDWTAGFSDSSPAVS